MVWRGEAQAVLLVLTDRSLDDATTLAVDRGVPDSALEVAVRMTHDATSGAPITTSAAPDDASSWSAEVVFPLEGPWQASVAVRLDRFSQDQGECTLTLQR